jgi:hypothetical protein
MDKVKKMSKLVVLSELKKYVKLNDEKTMKGTFIKTLEKEDIFDNPINKTTELHLVKLGNKSVLVPIIKKEDIQTNPIDDKALSVLLSKIKNPNDRDIVKQYITQQNMQEVINIGKLKREVIEKKNDGDGDEVNDETKQFLEAKNELQKKIQKVATMEELEKLIKDDDSEYKQLLLKLRELKMNKTAGNLAVTINAAQRRLQLKEAIGKEKQATQERIVTAKTEAARKKEERAKQALQRIEEERIAKEEAAEKARIDKQAKEAADKEAAKKAKEEARANREKVKKERAEAEKAAKAEAKEMAKEEMEAYGANAKKLLKPAPKVEKKKKEMTEEEEYEDYLEKLDEIDKKRDEYAKRISSTMSEADAREFLNSYKYQDKQDRGEEEPDKQFEEIIIKKFGLSKEEYESLRIKNIKEVIPKTEKTYANFRDDPRVRKVLRGLQQHAMNGPQEFLKDLSELEEKFKRPFKGTDKERSSLQRVLDKIQLQVYLPDEQLFSIFGKKIEDYFEKEKKQTEEDKKENAEIARKYREEQMKKQEQAKKEEEEREKKRKKEYEEDQRRIKAEREEARKKSEEEIRAKHDNERKRREEAQDKAEKEIEEIRNKISSPLKGAKKEKFKQLMKELDTIDQSNFLKKQIIERSDLDYYNRVVSKEDHEKQTEENKRIIKENEKNESKIKDILFNEYELYRQSINSIMYQNVKY